MKRKYMYIFILICIFLLTSCGEKTTDLSSNLYTENNDIHSFVLNELKSTELIHLYKLVPLVYLLKSINALFSLLPPL